MPLDLLVPDLLLPADAPAPMRALRLPALEKWLARADVERGDAASVHACIASAYGLAARPPVAALALAGEEEAPRPGSWVRADPVHLRVERDGLTLHDAAILDVTRAEADALVATLQALFAPDLEFHVAAPDRWYARVPDGELPSTTPLETARARNVFGMLPGGKGRINWGSAITEAQMVMSGHEVNSRREAAGLPAINSVWFWGEGTLPPHVEKPYAAVYARERFARGLARHSGAAVRDIPAGVSGVDLVGKDQSALVVLDTLTRPLHRVDAAQWQSAAEALDEHWFRELGQAIERFDRVRVVLPADPGSRIAVLTGAARRRWYRRSKPLAAHA
jgi:hypothetical protein